MTDEGNSRRMETLMSIRRLERARALRALAAAETRAAEADAALEAVQSHIDELNRMLSPIASSGVKRGGALAAAATNRARTLTALKQAEAEHQGRLDDVALTHGALEDARMEVHRCQRALEASEKFGKWNLSAADSRPPFNSTE